MAKSDGNALDERDYKIIQMMAEKNLNVSMTAEALYMHRNTVVYHIEKIKRITGLDARLFFDLHKLLKKTAKIMPGRNKP